MTWVQGIHPHVERVKRPEMQEVADFTENSNRTTQVPENDAEILVEHDLARRYSAGSDEQEGEDKEDTKDNNE